MPDPVESLVLDLLEWVGTSQRPYSEVMDAWRTSCPRLPIWEEANARGPDRNQTRAGLRGQGLRVSIAGHAYLAHRRAAVTRASV